MPYCTVPVTYTVMRNKKSTGTLDCTVLYCTLTLQYNNTVIRCLALCFSACLGPKSTSETNCRSWVRWWDLFLDFFIPRSIFYSLENGRAPRPRQQTTNDNLWGRNHYSRGVQYITVRYYCKSIGPNENQSLTIFLTTVSRASTVLDRFIYLARASKTSQCVFSLSDNKS